MNESWMPVAVAVAAACSVLLASLPVLRRQREQAKHRSLRLVLSAGVRSGASARGSGAGSQDGPEDGLGTSQSVIGAGLQALGSRLTTSRSRRRLQTQLSWAGRPAPADLASVLRAKAGYLVVGLVFGLLIGAGGGGAWWWIALAGPIVGFRIPDLLVYNEALKRTERIARTLPDALDLLDLCVESGLSMQAALSRIARHQDGPVADEFGRVLREMQLGVSRQEAFEAMARRTRQPDMQRFVSAVLQADRLGVPIAAVLKEQAREMRSRRRDRAREQAQKVPVKILMPLMTCLLPGLFIVIMGPAAINVMRVFAG